MAEANPKSHKERMREARAAASAQRKAEKAAWQRQAETMAEARRMALEAVKLTIRDRGDKVQNYTPAQLRVQADLMMGPWSGSLNEILNICTKRQGLRRKHFQ